MRRIRQEEAEQMREALKTIASFLNPATQQDGGQAAARLARETLERLDLFSSVDDVREEAAGRGKDGTST